MVIRKAVLPDGRLASASPDTTISLWNLTSRQCETIFEEGTGRVPVPNRLKERKPWPTSSRTRLSSAARDSIRSSEYRMTLLIWKMSLLARFQGKVIELQI
jgi:WD40 repeat protein